MQKESPVIVVLTKKIDEQCIAFLPFFLFNICNYRSVNSLFFVIMHSGLSEINKLFHENINYI